MPRSPARRRWSTWPPRRPRLQQRKLDAEVRKQADAELYRRQKEAEAQKYEAERAAEAAKFAKQQEAEGIGAGSARPRRRPSARRAWQRPRR